jgi:heparan-alpha-glucosaminide N-acetyltransferase
MPSRVVSIDILRAITMILMIFVNDLWSLTDIPIWLEHAAPGADGIGLADTIFPAFLFIVGLSIPFSLYNRQANGDSSWQQVQHIMIRTFALLVMGVFLVNGEDINEIASGVPRHGYNTLCCLSFILIWNAYPKTANKNGTIAAKGVGMLILITLAFIYRGGEPLGNFSPKWWGILGLIGWAYGASGLVTVFARNNFLVILLGWAFFCLLSIASHAGLLPQGRIFSFFHPIFNGTLVALTIGGVLTSFIFRHYTDRHDPKKLMAVLLLFSLALTGFSLVTRSFWGLSKLGATPAWLFLCSALTILAFAFLYWLIEWKGKANWFEPFKPAGTDTLLCYLIPYFSYALVSLAGIRWPDLMLTGGTGLLKSFLFALLCVWIAGRANKSGVRLKL